MRQISTTATILDLVPHLEATGQRRTHLATESWVFSVGSDTLVLIREDEISKAGAFAKFAREFRPRCILDVRLAPRLDLFAGNRIRAFRLFEELNVQYVDVLGRMGVHSAEDFTSLDNGLSYSILSAVKATETTKGPLVCIFDDSNILLACRNSLAPAISAYVNGRNSVSISEYRSGLLAL